jgi:hypothetical protein
MSHGNMASAVTPPINPHNVEFILCYLLQTPTAITDTQDLITPEYFTAEEQVLAVLWQCIREARQQSWGTTVPVLQDMVRSRLTVSPVAILNCERFITERIPTIVNHQLTVAEKEYGQSLLDRFLVERGVVRRLRRELATPDAVGNLNGFLADVGTRLSRATGSRNIPRSDVVPVVGTPLEPSHVFYQTGINYIDNPLGGLCAGEAWGLVGPTGGGKSTTAMHIAVSTARHGWTEATGAGTPVPWVAYVSVEQPPKKLRPMLWAQSFFIDRAVCTGMNDWSALCGPGQSRPYEDIYWGGCATRPSELERYRAGSLWFNSCFSMFDFSGSPEFPHAGRGYVPEVASALRRTSDTLAGRPLRLVVIDYAGLLVERSDLLAGARDYEKAKYRLLRGFADECRRLIAEAFQCTVLMIHQLRGAACDASPLRLVSISDSADCKAIGDNAAVFLGLGTYCRRTGCRRLNYAKTRNVQETACQPATLRIHPHFSTVDDVSNVYRVDDVAHAFCAVGDLRRIQGI